MTSGLVSSGQQVPILCVGTLSQPVDFRSLTAIAEREQPRGSESKVKAIVKALTDAELVIAQGKENLERRDPSFGRKGDVRHGVWRSRALSVRPSLQHSRPTRAI